jgi:hypothetical protein
MNGEGHYIWGDGREYIGIKLFYIGGYKNDKKHGFGKYTWADGRQYIGYWENGKQHGNGKYILEGGYQIGRWMKGKRTSWLSENEIEELKSDPAFARILKSN